MRCFALTAIALGLLVGPLTRPASAVSVDDLISLRANGLSDDVLVALIETDGSAFRLSADDVLALHKRGLGERIIMAMLEADKRAARARTTVRRESEPAEVVLVTRHEDAPQPTVVVQQTVEQTIVQKVEQIHTVIVERRDAPPVKPVEPVYWGFGGRLRPDSWKPSPQ